MKAGMNFKNNGDQKQTPPKPTPPKPRGRRGMPVMDLKKGIPVSADVAKALIANGAADVRPKQPAVVPNSSTTNSAAGIAPSTGVGAGYQASSNPSTQTTASSVPTVCKALLQARVLLMQSSFFRMETRSAHQIAQSAGQAAIRQMIQKTPAMVREPCVSQLQPTPPLYLVRMLLPPVKSANPPKPHRLPRSAPGSVSIGQQTTSKNAACANSTCSNSLQRLRQHFFFDFSIR